MWTMNPIIVFIMLFAPSLCQFPDIEFPQIDPPKPDRGSPEEFLKEVNELRAKFAKEHRIPNMYKLTMLTEKTLEEPYRLSKSSRSLYFDSYQNMTEKISKEVNIFEKVLNEFKYVEGDVLGPAGRRSKYLELLNPLHAFIECSAEFFVDCTLGYSGYLNFWYANPGEAGSQCPPRFKGENGLCVPVDPSKHTFWGTEEGLLEDVNYIRRKYAKEFGIPNMHQLTWNESLTAVLDPLHVAIGRLKSDDWGYLGPENSENSPSWVGFQSNWRITELRSFSAAVPNIDEAVHFEEVPGELRKQGNSEEGLELIHPLQTSIGCMKKGIKDGKTIVVCLVGNMGQWPSDWKMDVNSTKIPGSECMDGYVNDDGLCVVAPSTTTPDPTTTAPEAPIAPKTSEAEPVTAIPKKPEASDEKTKEGGSVGQDADLEPGQEALESSVTTRIYSFGPWIFAFIFLLF